MPSQRPYFLSTFFAAFRQPPTTLPAASASGTAKHVSQTTPNASASTTATRGIASAAVAAAANASASSSPSPPLAATTPPRPAAAGYTHHNHPLHSPRNGIPIPQPGNHRPAVNATYESRRRGSDSSSEGFREVVGAEKWYIGGRTAGGEEKFFKMGVVKRPRSVDRLSLDRLSL